MRAEFLTPDPEALSERGLTAVDMHFHTDCSDSSTDPVAAVRLAERRGIGFAVTDHNLISSVRRIRDADPRVPVIPGMEVSTSDGPHILVYFPNHRDLERFWFTRIRPRIQENPWLALRDCPTERLLELCEGEDCVVSAAHPMGYLGSNKGVEVCIRKGILDPSVARRLDAYEVISGGMTREHNEAAVDAALSYGIGFTGGTDSHFLEGMGAVVTVSGHSTVEGILEDVREHRVDVIGTEYGRGDRVRTGRESALRFARHVPSVVSVKARGLVRRRFLGCVGLLLPLPGPEPLDVHRQDGQHRHTQDHQVVPQLHLDGVGHEQDDQEVDHHDQQVRVQVQEVQELLVPLGRVVL